MTFVPISYAKFCGIGSLVYHVVYGKILLWQKGDQKARVYLIRASIFACSNGMRRRVYIGRNDASGRAIASALARKNADGMRRIARVNAAFAKRFLD